MKSELLIATNNPGKVRELLDLLEGSGIRVITPAEAGLRLEVVEDGQTYAENASRKALAFAKASGRVSLADDSGLEVDALNGAPGLHSARYSPRPGASDADRRALLLENLKDKPRPWLARFHATIAVALPSGRVELTEGVCPGEIIPTERGSGGFGYDPIFLLRDLDRTMAELDLERKNRLSHRARAVQRAKPLILKLLGGDSAG